MVTFFVVSNIGCELRSHRCSVVLTCPAVIRFSTCYTVQSCLHTNVDTGPLTED